MFEEELDALRDKGLLRSVRDRGSPQGPRISIDGKSLVNFASNDYLGLASHPAVIRASAEAAKKWGAGAGASRLLGGGCDLHAILEDSVATIKGASKALLFNSGYSANTGAVASLAGEGDALFSDEMNHASIIDGCRLSRAETRVYRHRDMEHLQGLMKDSSARRRIILSDTVFSMEGDLAPLRDLNALAEDHGAILYLDDAHGTGVLGGGAGALAHAEVEPAPHIIQMGTFSKALGSAGGFIASEKGISELLLNRARPFIFSTSLPPATVAASLKALEIMKGAPGLIEKLWENRARLATHLGRLGLGSGDSESPIIPVRAEDNEGAAKLSEALFARGFYAPAIRPPSVPRAMLRITVSATHRAGEIDGFASAMEDLL
jgi:8-amino-7-oxononanoate synthase